MAFRQIKTPALADQAVINTKLDVTSVSGQTELASLGAVSADMFLIYDSSADALKKISATNILGSMDTDALAEGASNLYYTDARVETKIDAYVLGGTGVDITDGLVSIGQDVATDADVTFNNITVDGTLTTDDITATDVTASGNMIVVGNLTVQGTTTTVDSTTVAIGDNIIELNKDATGAPALDAGIEINRGDEAAVSFLWDETNDRWTTGGQAIKASQIVLDAGGSFVGDLIGDVTGDVTGNLTGDVTGNVTGNVTGDLTGDVTGDVTGNLTGDVTGNVTGDVTGDLTGNVTGQVSDISNHTTTDLTEGTNLYFTDARADSRIAAAVLGDLANVDTTGLADGVTIAYDGVAGSFVLADHFDTTDFVNNFALKTTDDLAEGTTNKYFSDARVRSALSFVDAGGDGSFAYDAATGVMTYTGPSAAEVRAHFSAGTGVDITDGVVSIGQDVATTASPTFVAVTANLTGDVTGDVTGNLTGDVTGDVTGNVTGDLTGNVTGDVTGDVTGNLTGDVTGNVTGDLTGNVTGDVTGDVTGQVSDISNHDTDALTEGSNNLYYTTARANADFDTRLATKTADDVAEGSTNFYYTEAKFDASLATKTADDLAEGSTNLYYTEAKFDASLATKTTDDLAEGSNLYYTDARVEAKIDAYVLGGTGVDVTDGVVSIGQDVATTANVQFNDVQIDGSAIIEGDLTVKGTTTTVNTTEILIADNIITLNSDFTAGAPTESAGIEVSRGDEATVSFQWDEVNDKWTTGGETLKAGSIELEAGGNFVGDLTGDVTGNVTGDLTGDVTGNVTGDLTGDVTGNVTGDVTGNLTGDVTGNLTGDVTGNVTGDLTGDVTGNVTGDLTGNVTGDVTGDVTGNLTGDVTGNVTGDLTGDVTGNVTGDLTGNVTGDVTGDVTGNLTGNAAGDHTGSMTGDVDVSAGTLTLADDQISGDKVEGGTIAAITIDALTAGGNIVMAGNGITGLVDPSAAQDAATKAYVDTAIQNQDISLYTTDDLTEGANNLYFTDARADARIALANLGDLANVDTTGAAQDKGLRYNAATSAWEVADLAATVLELTDVTDSSYVGKDNYILQVNDSEDGMELIDPASLVFAQNNRVTLNGDGGTSTFNLGFTANEAYALVFVGGVIQDPTTAYNITGSSITFVSAIPSGTQAVVINPSVGSVPSLIAGSVTFDKFATNIKAYVQKLAVTAGTGGNTVDTFDGTAYRSAKYIIQVANAAGTEFETREALVVHDGSNAYITEYALVYTGAGLLGDASVAMSGTDVNLVYTANAADSTVKVIATYIDA